MSVSPLLSARAILEPARGGGGTPTRLVYFDTGMFTTDIASILPREQRASFRPNFRAYPGIERDGFKFTGDFTPDDAPWWLNLHVKALASGSVTDTTAYTWTFQPTNTADDQKSASLQWASIDSIATATGYQLNGVLGDQLKLTFKKDGSVLFDSTLMSAYAATKIAAFTGSLSDRVVTSIPGIAFQAFIDPTTIGTTPDTAVLDAVWTLNNHYAYRDALDNTNHAAEIVRTAKQDWTLQLTRYFNDHQEYDAFVAKTERKIRIIAVGGLAGSTTAKYTVQVDCYAVLDKHVFVDQGGLIFAQLNYLPLYDTTFLGDYQVVAINKTASIT